MFNDKRLTFNETLSATSLLVSLTQRDNSFFMYSSPGITPQSVNRQGPLGLLWVPKGTVVARFVPASGWKLAYTHNERRQSSLKATQCCDFALPSYHEEHCEL